MAKQYRRLDFDRRRAIVVLLSGSSERTWPGLRSRVDGCAKSIGTRRCRYTLRLFRRVVALSSRSVLPPLWCRLRVLIRRSGQYQTANLGLVRAFLFRRSRFRLYPGTTLRRRFGRYVLRSVFVHGTLHPGRLHLPRVGRSSRSQRTVPGWNLRLFDRGVR